MEHYRTLLLYTILAMLTNLSYEPKCLPACWCNLVEVMFLFKTDSGSWSEQYANKNFIFCVILSNRKQIWSTCTGTTRTGHSIKLSYFSVLRYSCCVRKYYLLSHGNHIYIYMGIFAGSDTIQNRAICIRG